MGKNEKTSRRVGGIASGLLNSPKTPKKVKSVAGSPSIQVGAANIARSL